MAIRHLFMWSVKDGHDADWVMEKMIEVTLKVPNLISWSAGKHTGDTDNATVGSYQYGLVIDAASVEDMNAYLDDPEQVATVDKAHESCQDWCWVDFDLDTSPSG